jgi:hypothetical protein
VVEEERSQASEGSNSNRDKQGLVDSWGRMVQSGMELMFEVEVE